MRGGGLSGGVAGAVVDLMLLVWFSLSRLDTHPCVRMLPAPPARLRLSPWGEQAGAKPAVSPRAGGASHVPAAHP